MFCKQFQTAIQAMKKIIPGDMIDSDGERLREASKEVKLMCDLHDKEEAAMRSPQAKNALSRRRVWCKVGSGRASEPRMEGN